YIGDSGRSAFVPVGPSRGRWTFELPQEASPDPTSDGLRTMLKHRGLGPWPRMERLMWADQMAFGEWFAMEFARDRVWLCGDAAHQVGPFAAHSMNAGIAEATHVASLIAENGAAADPANITRIYDTDRRRHW